MGIKDLNNKLVAVLGYGLEGKATLNYLLKHGIKPVLFDERPWEEWEKSEQDEIKALGVNFIFGPQAFFELKGFDVAFRSPGIKISQLTFIPSSRADKSARYGAGNLQLTSQTKFFFDNCPCKIIGVTGTKGKGTTSSLIYEVLSKQSKILNLKSKIFLTGNIGKTQPFEILDSLKPNDWVVYELSSFQLQDLEKSPHIGVVLMVTSEHLDYHKSLAEYIRAKSAIVKYQVKDDFAIVNSDFPSSVLVGEEGYGKKIYFSRKNKLTSGVCIENEQVVIKNVKGQNFQFPISNFQLRGAHNLENVCAAIGAVIAAGITDSRVLQSAVEEFKGLEHRLEFVAEKKGIKFYNDSFSTTPETATAAIKSFSEPLIVILGGSSKNSDFAELGKCISSISNLKAIILIGQEANKIKSAIAHTSATILEGAKSMQEIFNMVKSVSLPGDVVLLSPGCASFDMFKNYKDRGEQFKNFVKIFNV